MMRIQILIAADESSETRNVADHLHRNNWQTIIVGTGAEALSALETERPLAALIDVRLPDTTGWDVLEHIRRDPRIRSTVVLLVYPAGTTDEDYFRGFKLGADASIPSPFNPRDAIAFLSRMVRAEPTVG